LRFILKAEARIRRLRRTRTHRHTMRRAEVFMAGGKLPASVPSLPQDFTEALRSELATFQ